MRHHPDILYFCNKSDNDSKHRHGTHFISATPSKECMKCKSDSDVINRCRGNGCPTCDICPYCKDQKETDILVDPATLKPDEGVRYRDTFDPDEMADFFRPKESKK